MPKLIRITTVPQSLKILLKGQHRFMLDNGFEVVGVSGKGPDLVDVQKDEGIHTVAIEMTRSITPLKDIKSLWKFYKLCKKENPSIVHSHTPKAGVVGMVAARFAKVPIRLHTVAGLPLMEAKGLKRMVLDFVEKITYHCATKVYPNSKGLYDFIIEHNYTRNGKLKVIGNGSSNGIDTSYFDPKCVSNEIKQRLRENLGIQPKDFVFIFVGRIVGDKGINELVSAFKEINKFSDSTCQSKLLLVGRMEEALDPLQYKTLEEIKNNPCILSLGYQKDVRPYFSISDVLVFPSYREGFPNVVMQAAAMQLNAIVSDINGCNEIIEDGNNGWIISVRDEKHLKERMKWCLYNRKESKKMGFNSREIIQSEFEQSFVWNMILKEYKQLLGSY